MTTRILLLLLCLGVLGTVSGCYIDPAPYGASSYGTYGYSGHDVGAYQGEPYYYGREYDYERRRHAEDRYRQRRWEQERAYRQWEREQRHSHDLLYGPWR